MKAVGNTYEVERKKNHWLKSPVGFANFDKQNKLTFGTVLVANF